MRYDPPICVGCRKTPERLPEFVDAAKRASRGTDEIWSPSAYCAEHEGTYNDETGTFYCDVCYVKAGQPLGVAPAIGGASGLLPDVTPLRRNVDKLFAKALMQEYGIDVHAVPKGAPTRDVLEAEASAAMGARLYRALMEGEVADLVKARLVPHLGCSSRDITVIATLNHGALKLHVSSGAPSVAQRLAELGFARE